MRPLVTFADAQLATVELLRTILAADVTALATGATVGTRTPRGTETPTTPYVLVRMSGQVLDSIIEASVQLRVSVWHDSEAKALELGQRLRNRLLNFAGDTEVRGFIPGQGPIPADDPESGAPFSFFTITARLRPLSE